MIRRDCPFVSFPKREERPARARLAPCGERGKALDRRRRERLRKRVGREPAHREALVVAHIVDSTGRSTLDKPTYDITEIIDTRKGTTVVECGQGPRHTRTHHIVQEIDFAFIAGSVYHAGA